MSESEREGDYILCLWQRKNSYIVDDLPASHFGQVESQFLSLKSSCCGVVVPVQTVLDRAGTKVVMHISALSWLASHSQMKPQCGCNVATYS